MRLHTSRVSIVSLGALALGLGSCAPDQSADSGRSADLAGKEQAAASTPEGKQLALGRAHGCSLDSGIDGVLCWGDNSQGQTDVPDLLNPSFIAAGGDVTCAIGTFGPRCWGDGSHGQLDVPLGLGTVTQLAVGSAHVCALTSRGEVRCWGDNDADQGKVPKLSKVLSISAGARHTCALTATAITCWGDNTNGQLDVPALSKPSQVAAGSAHTCAIVGTKPVGDKVVCWGGASKAIVSDVPAVTRPSVIAAGEQHSCVVDATGVQCWGEGDASDLTPPELTNVQQLAIGGGGGLAHACSRDLQGVKCWGDNSLGQTKYDGGTFHVLHHSEATINAPAALIWDVLMDLDGYPDWNPYTTAMMSTLKIGDPMVMTVKMDDLITLTQTENIRVLEEGHKVCWGIDTDTPTLNSGERCQWLEPHADGSVRYVTEDLIEGSLNPLVTALFGQDVQVGFDGVAKALKAHCEALNAP